MEGLGGARPRRTEQQENAAAFVARAQQKKAAARAAAVRAARREAAQWGDLGGNATVAPFPGPFGPIVIPNPKYFNDRKWDDKRATDLARHVGAPTPWAVSSGPIPHWAPYDATRDRYNPRAKASLDAVASAKPGARQRRRQLPAVVRERLAALQLQEAATSAPGQQGPQEECETVAGLGDDGSDGEAAAVEAAEAAADAAAAAAEAVAAARASAEAVSVAAARAQAAAEVAAAAEASALEEAEVAALLGLAASRNSTEQELQRVPTINMARLGPTAERLPLDGWVNGRHRPSPSQVKALRVAATQSERGSALAVSRSSWLRSVEALRTAPLR